MEYLQGYCDRRSGTARRRARDAPRNASRPRLAQPTLTLFVLCNPLANMCLCTVFANASLAQLVEHTLRKRAVMGSIPIGGSTLLRQTLGGVMCMACFGRRWEVGSQLTIGGRHPKPNDAIGLLA